MQLQSGLAGEDADAAGTEDSPNPPDESGGAAGGATPEAAAPAEAQPGETGSIEPAEALSQSAPEGQPPAMPPELAELDEDVRDELLAIAKEVADGKTSFRDIKRGHKLVGKHAEELERLTAENERLRQEASQAPPPQTMSEEMQRLKTVGEAESFQEKLQSFMDWAEDNPDGGTWRGQEWTPEDIKQTRPTARTTLRQLPQRKAQLEKQAQLASQQKQARTQAVKMFPHLNDPENAETQAVTTLLEQQPWVRDLFVSPEIAALTFIRGQAAIKAELDKRGKTPAKAPAAAAAPQRSRPATGSTAGTRVDTGPSVTKAKERIATEHSVGALGDLIGASGLG